jgi:hypothetical protein
VQLSKVKIRYYPGNQRLVGLKFYSKDGAVVLKTGFDWVAYDYFKTHTVYLADGERVIGYKSRSGTNFPAKHHDFQLIIGRPI